MAFKFFAVSVRVPEAAEAQLNRFLAAHQVLSIERRLIDCGVIESGGLAAIPGEPHGRARCSGEGGQK